MEGDFVLEREECKDGKIPFLWRKGRSDLMQKYSRREENGKIYYENILSVSMYSTLDWWPSRDTACGYTLTLTI